MHVDRLKLEENVTQREAPHVRECFPVGESNLDDECVRVADNELCKAGLKEPNRNIPVAEQFLAQELILNENRGSIMKLQPQAVGLSDEAFEQNARNNMHEVAQSNRKDTAVANENTGVAGNDLNAQKYPLRNRGKKVDENEWVMRRPVEYKR